MPLLADLRAEASECRACDLWARATQVVFGAGPANASLMLVGEQPGDEEDRAGAPFVGTARGADLDVHGRPLVATIHPSAVLRTREHDERAAAFDGLVADLRRARSLLG